MDFERVRRAAITFDDGWTMSNGSIEFGVCFAAEDALVELLRVLANTHAAGDCWCDKGEAGLCVVCFQALALADAILGDSND